jgi:GntR family transcriptional repressor for pyruvate dehydrogenase complex
MLNLEVLQIGHNMQTVESSHIAVPREAYPRVPKEDLATRSAEILKSHILRESLPPKHRMPSERRLADWLNVSRMVLRSAIAKLEQEGVLYRPSPRTLCVAEFDRGAHQGEIDLISLISREQLDLIELRAFIEIGALEQIIIKMTPQHLGEIERWVIEGEKRFEEQAPIYPADAKFHVALLRSIGNSSIDSLLPMIQESMRLLLVFNPYQLAWANESMARVVIDEHRNIYEAIKREDLGMATRWMRSHHQLNIELAQRIAAGDPASEGIMLGARDISGPIA